MLLFKLTRLDLNPDELVEANRYEIAGMVVAAVSSAAARQIAARHTGAEAATVWTDSTRSRCTMIGRARRRLEAGPILRDTYIW